MGEQMALDAEDLAALSALMDKKLSGFVTADQANKLVGEQVTSAITAATSSLSDDVMKAIKDAGVGGDGSTGDKGKGGNTAGNAGAESDEMKRAKQQLADMTSQMQRAKEAQEQATERERQSRLDTQLGVALQAAGVPLNRVPHATAYLRTLNNGKGEPFLAFDDAGQPQWNGIHAAGYPDPVSLKDGIASFMKSDDGKTFLPPVDASGTGTRHRIDTKPPLTSEGAVDMSRLSDRVLSSMSGLKIG